ncbi:MAG TPA: SDR family oxidoreductase [Acidimicrobiia bacterium]|jgi:NAD(P)-dependent dehydrogenase (short-subunit alcohol dehydrogenase family)
MTLDGRVALVTGGNRGIGAAIACGLAADGADVAVSYRRDADSAAATLAEIEAGGRRAVAFQAPFDDSDAADAMAGAVLDEFGHVDILVHSAGIASRGMTVVDTDPAEIERLFRVHALSAFVLCKRLVPQMRELARGDVVMISSAATVYWGPNSSPYNMGKAALEALARTLAKEERRNGIHVNVVAPGLVDTEMGRRLVKATRGAEDIRELDASSPFGHVCTPEEVADVVRFVVSDAAAYVTDQRIGVEGGPF